MTETTRRPLPTPHTEGADRLGLPQSTALVMGSIIGVGICSLPYAIASYGPISILPGSTRPDQESAAVNNPAASTAKQNHRLTHNEHRSTTSDPGHPSSSRQTSHEH